MADSRQSGDSAERPVSQVMSPRSTAAGVAVPLVGCNEAMVPSPYRGSRSPRRNEVPSQPPSSSTSVSPEVQFPIALPPLEEGYQPVERLGLSGNEASQNVSQAISVPPPLYRYQGRADYMAVERLAPSEMKRVWRVN